MTFIEVLIAIAITGMILSSMFTGLNFAYKYARHNANKTMALNFAQGLMEEVRDKDYEDEYATSANYHLGDYTNFLGPELNTIDVPESDDDLDEDDSVGKAEFDDVDDYNGYTDTVNLYQNEDVNVQAIRTVVIADQNGNTILDSDEYGAITYKKITVTVSWDWQGKSYSEEVNTIVCDLGSMI